MPAYSHNAEVEKRSCISICVFHNHIHTQDLTVQCLVSTVLQCADGQDAVCTRSVTLTLPSLDNMTVKLKHGGMVSVNGMNIQTPMLHGNVIRFKAGIHLVMQNDLP